MSSLKPFALGLMMMVGGLVGCATETDDASTGGSADEIIQPRNRDLTLGAEARFKSFGVTVNRHVVREQGGNAWVGIDVRVCAIGTENRVTWSPWKVEFSRHVGPGDKAETTKFGPDSSGKTPFPQERLYPQEAILSAGECAAGIVPFFLGSYDPSADFFEFYYSNSLENEANWIPFAAH